MTEREIEKWPKEPWPEEYKANREEVVREFKDLGIEIETAPELLERLIELKEDGHFDDASRMAKIIDKYPGLSEEEKRKLKIAALLHDLGKTGDADETKENRRLTRLIYTYNFPKGMGKEKARDVLNLMVHPDKDKVIEYLIKKNIDIDNRPMEDLWRDHVDYTNNIISKFLESKNVNKNLKKEINDEIRKIAVSHHILDGKIPAGLTASRIPVGGKRLEIIDKYQILTLVDKYQAFIDRSAFSHEKAISKLEEVVAKSSLLEEVKKEYVEVIRNLATVKELEKIAGGKARAA